MQVIIEGTAKAGYKVSVLNGVHTTPFMSYPCSTFKQAKKLANMVRDTFNIELPVDDVAHNWNK